MNKTKQHYKTIPVTRSMVDSAYQKVKKGGKSAGVDGISMKEFAEKEEKNLYKIWNRLTSGSYYPPAVRRVEIPKSPGKTRSLGIPTVGDRVAQMVVKEEIEPKLEGEFLENTYGYIKGKGALEAVGKVRENVWKKSWVIDLDIEKFFDSVDHELLMKVLSRHVEPKWLKMYISRWLKSGVINTKGEREETKVGVPQGGVISPLLSNIFIHYVVDKWMEKHYPEVVMVRYSDDVIIHCETKEEAEEVLSSLTERLRRCKLKINEEKTKIIYCKSSRNRNNDSEVSFDFLGYTFKPMTKCKNGKLFLGYDCEISKKSRKKVIREIRKLRIERKTGKNLSTISREINPKVQGWINYYGRYGRNGLRSIVMKLDKRLLKWVLNRYKSLKRSVKKGYKLLGKLKECRGIIPAHWKYKMTII